MKKIAVKIIQNTLILVLSTLSINTTLGQNAPDNRHCCPISLASAPNGVNGRLPDFTLKVNFHFIAKTNGGGFKDILQGEPNYGNGWNFNNPPVNGSKYADKLVEEANNSFSSLSADPIALESYIGESFLHFELNEIHFWNSRLEYNSQHSNNGDGLDVILTEDNGNNHPGGAAGTSSVTLYDAYDDQVMPWFEAGVFMHEVGHVFGLKHAFEDCNVCNGVDIDPIDECNNGAGTADADCGMGNEGNCYNLDSNGAPRSVNFMNYHPTQHVSMTPCQNAAMYNAVLCADSGSPLATMGELDLCSNPENDLVITGDVIWSSTQLMNRHIIIQSGASLTIDGCQLRMGPDKYIAVKKGGRLVVNYSTITKLCPRRWSGIWVEGNNGPQPASALSNGPSDCGAVFLDNALIELSNWGIRDHSPGILVQAEGSTFQHSSFGVSFLRAYNFDQNSYFKTCTFDNLTHGIVAFDNKGLEIYSEKLFQ